MEQLHAVLDRIIQGFNTLLDRAPGAFANPRAYPQEAIVIAASVALALVLLVLMVLVAIDTIGRHISRRRQGLRVRRSGYVGLGRAAAVFVALAGLAFVFVMAPAVPAAGRLCGTCHATQAAVQAWETDVHGGVSCYGCHARRGLIGVVQAGAEGIASVASAEETTETRAPVFESRCIGCHHKIERGVTDGPVRMRHSDVIEAGYACLSCHPAVGHRSMERAELPVVRSRMSARPGPFGHAGDRAGRGERAHGPLRRVPRSRDRAQVRRVPRPRVAASGVIRWRACGSELGRSGAVRAMPRAGGARQRVRLPRGRHQHPRHVQRVVPGSCGVRGDDVAGRLQLPCRIVLPVLPRTTAVTRGIRVAVEVAVSRC